MKEYVEFRVNQEYAHLLFREDEGVNLGSFVKKVNIVPTDPKFVEIGRLQEEMQKKQTYFFSSYEYKRVYTEAEIENAAWFRIKKTRHFEPAGEECGTIYDESTACPICGAGARQSNPLRLKRSTIPHADMAETIAHGDETIVSERFVEMAKEHNLSGMAFEPVYGSGKHMPKLNYYQIRPCNYLEFSDKTIFGQTPFNLSGMFPGVKREHLQRDGTIITEVFPPEIYKCPNGDNVGLGIMSEPYIKYSPILEGLDFFASRQTIGGRGGLIRQSHLLFCSNRMMRLIKENGLKGFRFEIAHIVDE